jgi:RNase P/RNase MRP subunit p29
MDEKSKKAKPSVELVDLTGEEGRKADVEQRSAEISEVARTAIPAKASGTASSGTASTGTASSGTASYGTASSKSTKQTKKVPLKKFSSEAESSEEEDDDSSEDSASLVSSEDESDTSESDADDSDLEVESKKPAKVSAATDPGDESDSESDASSVSESQAKFEKKKAKLSAGRSSDSKGESKSKSSKSQARSGSVTSKDKFKDKSEKNGKGVTNRAWIGERPAIFVGTELRPVTGVKFCNPDSGLIHTLSNQQGTTFVKGGFYFAKSDGARVLAAKRIEQPDNVCIPEASAKLFEVCKKKGNEKSGLVLLGCVVSIEGKQIVKTRRNEEVPMREYVMQFRSKDGCFKSSPITVWGRLAKDRPEVGAFYILLNAKQADYLGMPRFSIGDNGAITKLDQTTPQIRDLKRFFATGNVDGELELPDGVSEWKETKKKSEVKSDDDE